MSVEPRELETRIARAIDQRSIARSRHWRLTVVSHPQQTYIRDERRLAGRLSALGVKGLCEESAFLRQPQQHSGLRTAEGA